MCIYIYIYVCIHIYTILICSRLGDPRARRAGRGREDADGAAREPDLDTFSGLYLWF